MHDIDLLITLTAEKNDENNVTIAFAMGSMAAKRGHATEILLLSNAVHLAKEGYADDIAIGDPFPAIKDALPGFMEAGGKIKVCSACMQHNGVAEDSIREGIEIVNADYAVDAIMAAKKSLQLN